MLPSLAVARLDLSYSVSSVGSSYRQTGHVFLELSHGKMHDEWYKCMHGSCFAIVWIGMSSLQTGHITPPFISLLVEMTTDGRFSTEDVAAGGAPLVVLLSSANCSRSISNCLAST